MKYYVWDLEVQQFNLKVKESKNFLDNQEWYRSVWCAFFQPCEVNNMSLKQKVKKFHKMLFVFQGHGGFLCRK